MKRLLVGLLIGLALAGAVADAAAPTVAAYYQRVLTSGTAVARRRDLNFVGATLTDSAALNRTTVTVGGSGITLTSPAINGTVTTSGLTLPAFATGGNIAMGTNALTGGTGGTFKINDTVGVESVFGSTVYRINGTSILYTAGGGNAANFVGLSQDTAQLAATAGATGFRYVSGTNGAVRYGVNSGTSSVNCGFAEELIASGTVTANKVVVWTGGGQVANAGASANLTTIAGVAIVGGAASALVIICRRGRVLVDGDAGITVNEYVGTSGATGGNVDDGTPGAGAVVGRATEDLSATVSGKVIVDVLLN